MRGEVALHVDKAEYDAQARSLKQHNYGATILVRGVPQWPRAAKRTLPLAPSAKLLRGHDPRERRAEMPRGRRANLAAGAFAGAPMGPRSS
eukprot:8827865-Pyramimonas_sp.AAC.1